MKKRKTEGDKDRCRVELETALTSIVWWCLVSAGSHMQTHTQTNTHTHTHTHTHTLTHKELSQSAINEMCLEQHKHMHSVSSHAEYPPCVNPCTWITITADCLDTVYLFLFFCFFFTAISTDMNVHL